MNRTKIEWCDYTWNPVTGCWGPGGTAKKRNQCWYCYAKALSKRFGNAEHQWPFDTFMPNFWPDRLSQPAKVKKPSRIFVCSMGDLFGDWVSDQWILAVLQVAQYNPHHTFIFLTKNPRRYQEFNPWPRNCWLGATVTNQADADERIPELLMTKLTPVRFVSIEPMLGPVHLSFNWFSCPGGPPNHLRWLILGAMTGPGSKAHQPDPAWVQSLIDQGRAAGIPVFLKDNLHWPEKIQEFPKCT